ncbi:MAG: hypothetical protein ACLT00_09070, partial [Collinsella sp.]
DAHISCGGIGTVFGLLAANQSLFHRNFFAAPSAYKILLAIGAFPAVRGALIGPRRYPVGKNGKYEYCHNFSNSKISLKLPTSTDFQAP